MKNDRIYDRDIEKDPLPEVMTESEREEILKQIKDLDQLMKEQECFHCRLVLRELRIHIKNEHGR